MQERITYCQMQLLGDCVAAAAAPVNFADALFKFKDFPSEQKAHFGESLIDLFGTGAGASSAKVAVWLWVQGAEDTGIKDANGVPGWWTLAGSDPNRGLLNNGNAITGTNGLTYLEPVYRIPMGSAIYLQATAVANLTSLKAFMRHRTRS